MKFCVWMLLFLSLGVNNSLAKDQVEVAKKDGAKGAYKSHGILIRKYYDAADVERAKLIENIEEAGLSDSERQRLLNEFESEFNEGLIQLYNLEFEPPWGRAAEEAPLAELDCPVFDKGYFFGFTRTYYSEFGFYSQEPQAIVQGILENPLPFPLVAALDIMITPLYVYWGFAEPYCVVQGPESLGK